MFIIIKLLIIGILIFYFLIKNSDYNHFPMCPFFLVMGVSYFKVQKARDKKSLLLYQYFFNDTLTPHN
jgi:hypothetical protein